MPGTVLPFKLERTDESITPHAGLALAHEFHLGLKVDRWLDQHVPAPGSGRGYRPSEVVLPLVLMLQGGGEDLEDIEVIRGDRALRTAAGLSRVPAETTLGDWLRRTGSDADSMAGLEAVRRELTRRRLAGEERTDFTLDIDTTIIAADKQDATKAYEGTTGYQPLLGFLFECQWALADEFRTGSASPQAGLVPFIEHCIEQMPPRKRIARLRSDSAGYNHDVTDSCEDHGIQYVIAADRDSAVVEAYRSIRADSWTPFLARNSRCEREVAQTIHTFNEGHTSFRLIFVRDVEPQKELLPDQPRGRAIITNIPDDEMTAAQVVSFYNDRGTAENFLKELKWGFGLRRVPCGQFEANASWVRIATIAYDLFLLQQHWALPPELARASVRTVRWRLYQLAGRLVRHAGRWFLKIATDVATYWMLKDLRHLAARCAVG